MRWVANGRWPTFLGWRVVLSPPNSCTGCNSCQLSFRSGTSQTANFAVTWMWTSTAGFITILLFARRRDRQRTVTLYWGVFVLKLERFAIFRSVLKLALLHGYGNWIVFLLTLGGLQFSEAHHKWRYHEYSKTTACGKCCYFGSAWKCVTDHKYRTEWKSDQI